MKINEVIRKYRKQANFTQEQVANYLGVTAPAVNKWENGISYPDITLLAPLARILKIDVDTLLSFHEELTELEINQMIKDISDLIQTDGYALGFEKGEALIKEYPNCDTLRLYTADILRAYLTIKETELSESYEHFESIIIGWYDVALTSTDVSIINSAKSSLVSYFMNKGDYQKAQQQLDSIQPMGLDMRLTQAILYEKQSRNEDAYKLYETMLFQDGNQICSVLQLICRLLSSEKYYEAAEKYANLSRDIAILLDLGDYTAYTSNFLLAVEKKDKIESIKMLEHMINGIDNLETYQDSNLYSHMNFNSNTNLESSKKLLRDALNHNAELDFIRTEPEARNLLRKLDY